MTPDRVMECSIVRHHNGHINGGQEDQDVPAGLEHAIVAEDPARLLGGRCLVLGKRLDVGGWGT